MGSGERYREIIAELMEGLKGAPTDSPEGKLLLVLEAATASYDRETQLAKELSEDRSDWERHHG
jgi:hypothetical protein